MKKYVFWFLLIVAAILVGGRIVEWMLRPHLERRDRLAMEALRSLLPPPPEPRRALPGPVGFAPEAAKA